MLRRMIYRLIDATVPRPPVLETALAERHVYTSWTGRELVYLVSNTCPNPDEVKVAINRRRLQYLVTVCEFVITAATLAIFVMLGSIVTRLFAVNSA